MVPERPAAQALMARLADAAGGARGHWRPLCRLDALPDPGARGFDPEGRGHSTLFVVRRGPLLRAYRDSCPHWPGTRLPWRRDAYLSADASEIVCAAHGARFDIASGECHLGPCVGDMLDALPLTLHDDGTLHVLIEETPEGDTP